MSGGGHDKDNSGALRKVVIVALLVGGVALVHRFAGTREGYDPSAMLALGFVVLASYTFGQLVERVGLPHITGYLIAGLALGPSAAHLFESWHLGPPFEQGILSGDVIDQLGPLETLAVALIALTAGGELKIASLRKGFGPILGVLGGQLVMIIGLCCAFVFGISGVIPMIALPGLGGLDLSAILALGAVVGSVSIATSPAATIAVINDVAARGPVTDTLLATVVLKDVVVVVLFAVVSTLAGQALGEGGGSDQALGLYLLQHIGGALALGAAIGFGMALYMRYVKRELLLFMVGSVFIASYLSGQLHTESVVLFITAGFVTANFSDEGDQLLETVETLSLPVYVVFFTLAGANLHLADIPTVAGFAITLVGLRVLGIYTGTRFGGRLGGASEGMRSAGWLGFVSQAGVAISLAGIIGTRLGEPGRALSTMIIAGIAINEVIGPVLLKVGLTRSGETADKREAAEHAADAPEAAAAAPDDASLAPWPEPDLGAEAWGEPLVTGSPELDHLTRDLTLDLTHVARDVGEVPLRRFREEALGYVRELRREFLRHHRRITVQASAETTALSAAEALRLEQAELAEKWRAAVIGRGARINQQPGWEPAPIVAAVDAISDGLPEQVLAPYEAHSFESREGESILTAARRVGLRVRRGSRRLFREEMSERPVPLRSLARFHLWGRLPARLEPVAALYAQAEAHLVARTRSMFEGIVIAYDELAAELAEEAERTRRSDAEAKAKAKAAKSGDGAKADAPNGAAPRASSVDGAPSSDAAAGEAADAPPPLEERLRLVRVAVEEELMLAVQEIDRIADDLSARTSRAIGACLRDVKQDLPHIAGPDLPTRKRAASLVYKSRGEALEWLERGSDAARSTSAAIYNRLALEMELHALEGRVKDALEEHATALGRDVRGRAHRQVERVEAQLVDAQEKLQAALQSAPTAAALAEEVRAIGEPLLRVAAEAARVATLLRDQLTDERSVTPVLDALTRAAQSLTDRYRVPAGPLARGELRLPPEVGTVEVPFRDWVLARIDASVAPRLLSSTREVAQRVEPLAQAFHELERRVAFNLELAVNELTVVEDEATSPESRTLVNDMIGGALERNAELFASHAHESASWGEDVRRAVREAVLGGLDELRGGLVEGEVGRMRSKMVRDVRGRRITRVLRELRTSTGRAAALVRHALRDAVGEARVDRMRAVIGLPPEVHGEHEPTARFEPQEPSASIPMVYRRLFSAQALEAGDILTGRDDALNRALALLEGKGHGALRTVAIIGPDGVGKSAFLNAVLRARRSSKVRELKLEAPATVEQVEALFDPPGEGHLYVITGLHWLRALRPGGFAPLRRLVQRVIADGGKNAFLVRADSLVWEQQAKLAPLEDAFPEQVRLDPLGADALGAAVLARHTVSGYGLVFSQGLEPQSRLEDAVMAATAPLSRPRQRFFRTLHTASGGLLRDALRLWLAAVTEVDETGDFVHLGPVPRPAIEALRQLDDDQVLTLYQVARQGWMSADVCAALFRLQPSAAEARLLSLAHIGVLESKGETYRVALHLRGSVRRLLEERGYIE